MRKFVVYRIQGGNVNGDTGLSDLAYHFALWVRVPAALREHRADPGFVSAVPRQSDRCPWGIRPDELERLRAGEFVEEHYDGQFPPDHPKEGIGLHILGHHARHQAGWDARAPAHTDHLGLGG